MKNIFNKLMLPNNFVTNQDLHVAYGKMGQYHVIVKHVVAQNQIVIHYQVGETSLEAGQVMRDFLTSFSSARKHVNYATYQNNSLDICISAKGSNVGEQVKEAMVTITDYLVANGLEECCSFCGNRGTDANGIYQLNEQIELMCPDCFRRMSSEEATGKKKKRTNLAAGIVGALFGSLIGVACWVLIYQMGYIAGITGFIMMVCCMKGFELLGGRLSRVGVVISILIAVAMLFVAEYLTVGIEVYKIFKDFYSDLSIFDGIRSVPYYLSEPELRGDMWGAIIKDLAVGYIFMAVASISFIRQSLKATADSVMQRLA